MGQYSYRIDPIDFGWEFLRTTKETIEMCRNTRLKDVPNDNVEDFVKQLRGDFQEAQRLARRKGWEGDFGKEARVIWLPDDGAFVYGFAWKQENNGTTFVVSPRSMDRLKRFSF